MEDLIEIYYSKLLNYEGDRNGFRKLVEDFGYASRSNGIQSNIKFFSRSACKRILRQNNENRRAFDEDLSGLDDLREDNRIWWKNFENKFNYWKKHVAIR